MKHSTVRPGLEARVAIVSITGVLLALLIGVATSRVANSQDTGWSQPVQISGDQWWAVRPVMTADAMGQLHVFWRERTGAEDPSIPGTETTIMYRRWDGRSWQLPIDVFVAPRVNGTVRVLAADVDNQGRLHVLWTGARQWDEALYHSWAWVQTPIDARSWTTQQVMVGRGMDHGDLKTDGENRVHIVVNEAAQHIYYIEGHQMDDGIYVWSDPVDIALLADTPIVAEPQIALTDHWIHVVWGEHNAKGFAIGVYYVRSRDGVRWETPRIVFRPAQDRSSRFMTGWISIATDSSGYVHLVWSRGVGRPDGRYHEWSEDEGATWSEPRVIREGYSGWTGHACLEIDAMGNLQLVTSANAGRGSQLFYNWWSKQDKQWRDFQLIGEDAGLEYPSCALTEGNVFHLVYPQFLELAVIFYRQLKLDAPSVPLMGYPVIPTATPVPPPNTPAAEHVSSITPSPSPLPAIGAASPPIKVQSNNLMPFVISVVPVIFLIAVTFVVHQRRRR